MQCLQGGFGSAQAIPYLDFDVIRANPKPFVGYSDITALHIAIRQATGLATLYGYGLVGVGDKDGTAFSRDRLVNVLTGDGTGEVPRDPDDPYVRALHGGKVTAPLVGGCLWLLMQTMGTPWEFESDDAILFFEDVKAPPYYVDGFLTQLAAAGKLQRVAGVVVGEMKDCDWGDQREASDWARSRRSKTCSRSTSSRSAFPCSTSFRSATGSTSLHFRSAFVVRSTPTAEPSRWTNRRSDREVIKEGDMKKRSLAILVLGLAVGAVDVFASGAPGSSSKSGGTFRIGTSSRIDSLNPYVAFNQDAYSTFMYIYPVLIQYDTANTSSCPTSRRSWKTSKDGKTWTFTTVADAKWSDGKPLTAADAAWTINTAVKYKGPVPRTPPA